MTIVGLNYSKLEVEKKENPSGKINISNNVQIKNVTKAELPIVTKDQQAVKFLFEFTSTYEPNIGNIVFNGEVLYLESTENSKKILDDWKKSKKVHKELMNIILNTVLSKCNIQALILSQEVNLPSPIPLPKISMEEPKK